MKASCEWSSHVAKSGLKQFLHAEYLEKMPNIISVRN